MSAGESSLLLLVERSRTQVISNDSGVHSPHRCHSISPVILRLLISLAVRTWMVLEEGERLTELALPCCLLSSRRGYFHEEKYLSPEPASAFKGLASHHEWALQTPVQTLCELQKAVS